ncbi:uncharacterized protein [Miscanthus floridulus]|uniref:uncharacterized protein isoform X1 n=1 Tax=Miscanthus floridulus TaxID=154761 RepID=UPI003458B241
MTRSMVPTPCLPRLLMRNAPRLFDEMPVQNAMTWNTRFHLPLCCSVTFILKADAETSEVYAHMTLQPLNLISTSSPTTGVDCKKTRAMGGNFIISFRAVTMKHQEFLSLIHK